MSNTPEQPQEPDATAPFWPFDHDAESAPTAAAGEEEQATTIRPPVDDAPRWTARANVPTPGDPALRQPAPQEWVEEEEDPYHGRSWLTPVIVAMVALVLIAALSVGVWLIYRATENGDNAPV